MIFTSHTSKIQTFPRVFLDSTQRIKKKTWKSKKSKKCESKDSVKICGFLDFCNSWWFPMLVRRLKYKRNSVEPRGTVLGIHNSFIAVAACLKFASLCSEPPILWHSFGWICEFLITAKSSVFTVVSMCFTYRRKTEVDPGGVTIYIYIYIYTCIHTYICTYTCTATCGCGCVLKLMCLELVGLKRFHCLWSHLWHWMLSDFYMPKRMLTTVVSPLFVCACVCMSCMWTHGM